MRCSRRYRTGLDTIETFGRGSSERFVLLPYGPDSVPTVGLELRLITELYRGRVDRYRPLLTLLPARDCDLAFMVRAMQAAGLPDTMQGEVLEELGAPPT
ncbi:MAG: hypothetical protein RDU89_00700 [bacterium]|nr:hypothetical protein [bacterium]